MKHVGFLLHFYQPPTQEPEIVKKIDSECYRPLFQLLRETDVEVTVNINYSLTEQLEIYAPRTLDILSGLSGCAFTASGAYHPVFPLIPPAEVKRQLELNDIGNRRLLGAVYKPEGVFPPEMALNMETARLIGAAGFRWTVTDDVPWVYQFGEVPAKWIPAVEGTGVLMRSNFWSNRISFHGGEGSSMVDSISSGMDAWAGEEDSYVILAMDGETFGHHREGAIETFLKPFFLKMKTMEDIRISSLNTIRNLFPLKETIIPSGSWSTSPGDLDSNEPFPLWDSSSVPNHETYWKLLNFVLEQCRKNPAEGVADSVDKMLYSCPLWWASPGRESYSQVRRGVLLIIKAALNGLSERALLDSVMELAGQIPAMAGKDK